MYLDGILVAWPNKVQPRVASNIMEAEVTGVWTRDFARSIGTEVHDEVLPRQTRPHKSSTFRVRFLRAYLRAAWYIFLILYIFKEKLYFSSLIRVVML